MAGKAANSAEDDDKVLTYEIPEAGALLGLTRAASYAAANRGDFGQLIQLGRRKKVSKAIFHRKYDPPAA